MFIAEKTECGACGKGASAAENRDADRILTQNSVHHSLKNAQITDMLLRAGHSGNLTPRTQFARRADICRTRCGSPNQGTIDPSVYPFCQ
ncbi:hypothetical protein [Burkholderia dolosa]|uniref:hypothetical protein n=1 Tax=Burkholderia dolosa TaxID=152500 RepID=UPI0027D21A31|nr:hypothetical protein [Burkholderia dolosa]